jgi:arylsulfatase A-like enzyme
MTDRTDGFASTSARTPISQGSSQKQPNVLLLMSDQQRADTLDPSNPCQTPHLDHLAQRGVRFTHALVPNSICSPSRASLMTGVFPSRHGMVDCTHTVERYRAEFDDTLPMWSQRLAEAGYTGGYFGKWHVERSNKLERFGFTEYVHKGDKAFYEYRSGLGYAKERQLSLQCTLSHPGYRDNLLYAVQEEPVEATEPYFMYSKGIDFIRQQASTGKPWFCVISTIEPHDPFVAPRPYFERYDPATLPIPSSYDDDLLDKPAVQRRIRPVWAELTPRQVQEATACYYAACTMLDEQVGRIVQSLEEMGQLDDTIIIYTSDHGEMLGHHGLFLKGVPAYEDVYNVPLVMAGPGITGAAAGSAGPTRAGEGHVNNVDLAPTILELTGARPIEDVDGFSLGPLLRDEVRDISMTPWDEAYAEFHGQRFFYTQRIVWHGQRKYIFNGFDIDELYDLEHDPKERRNLAGDPAHREVLEEMAARMWHRAHRLGDHNIVDSHYGMFRFAPVGPLAGTEGATRSAPKAAAGGQHRA